MANVRMLSRMRIVLFVLLTTTVARAQTAPAQRPVMAEDVFKNITVLKGIPVDEFMDTMGMFSAALSYNCTDCHETNNWADFAKDIPSKQRARGMIAMVNNLNRTNFRGQPLVTCYTCHRGDAKPKVAPSLTLQYGEPLEDPNEVQQFPVTQSAAIDAVFNKYIQAIGGAQGVAALKNFTAKGTYEGYDTSGVKVPVEVFATAPNRRSTIVHMAPGDSVRTFDGGAGWIASPDRPMPLIALTGGNIDGARLEAILSFPSEIKGAFAQWRGGTTSINDKEVQVLQGTNPGQFPVNFYFDEAGLLVRVLRFNVTMVGRVPTQIDFSNYREVAGVKMPFKFVTTWTNGQTTTEWTDIQPNSNIDASRFGTPAPAAPPRLR